MRYHEITESDELTAEPFDGVDPISHKPDVSYRIRRGTEVLGVIAGRFANTPEAALVRFRSREVERQAEAERVRQDTYQFYNRPPVKKPALRSMFEIVDKDTIDYSDAPDAFYYHVTSRPQTVLRDGLRINRRPNMADGFYANYSVGKIFFCDRAGVPYWLEKIANHLEAKYEHPPKLSVVRFPKTAVSDAEHDQLGSSDSTEPAYFVTHPIRPESRSVWL
jgi:hypothetical protein